MVKRRGVEKKVEFSLKDVVDRFGDRDQFHELSELGYSLSHELFDLLKLSDSGGELSVSELYRVSISAAEKLGGRYVVIKKNY